MNNILILLNENINLIWEVLENDARTVEDVIRITGAMENDDCIKNNPRGYCCWSIIQEAIDKALSNKITEN